jgi:uncharacterized surface protein with fasciclin (FAS1) repeats
LTFLEETQDLTVFAPMNKVFAQLPASALDGIDVKTVLLKHVLKVSHLILLV